MRKISIISLLLTVFLLGGVVWADTGSRDLYPSHQPKLDSAKKDRNIGESATERFLPPDIMSSSISRKFKNESGVDRTDLHIWFNGPVDASSGVSEPHEPFADVTNNGSNVIVFSNGTLPVGGTTSCIRFDSPADGLAIDSAKWTPDYVTLQEQEIIACARVGACCYDETADCEDDIEESGCQGGRFEAETLCEDLDPPCGEGEGACCFAGVCEATTTEEECDALEGDWYQGETCPEFECPAPWCADDIVAEVKYINGFPYDDYGSPASQYASDYPLAAGAADDITPDADMKVNMVETWTTHWNGAEGQGPNLYECICVTFYYNYVHPDSGDMPDGYLGDNGVRVAYDVGWIQTECVPMDQVSYWFEGGCTGDRWHLMIPVTEVTLSAGVKYWLEVQPCMPFSGGMQSAVLIGDQNTGDRAKRIFPLFGYDPWNDIAGNTGSCPDTDPAGTWTDLAFCLHGPWGEVDVSITDARLVDRDTGLPIDTLVMSQSDSVMLMYQATVNTVPLAGQETVTKKIETNTIMKLSSSERSRFPFPPPFQTGDIVLQDGRIKEQHHPVIMPPGQERPGLANSVGFRIPANEACPACPAEDTDPPRPHKWQVDKVNGDFRFCKHFVGDSTTLEVNENGLATVHEYGHPEPRHRTYTMQKPDSGEIIWDAIGKRVNEPGWNEEDLDQNSWFFPVAMATGTYPIEVVVDIEVEYAVDIDPSNNYFYFTFYLVIQDDAGDCVYIPGDCNHNGVALELADIISMIAYYRGQQTPQYSCPCPPHGDNFAPDADPNSNCTTFELADVVTEIAFYRGTQTPGGGCQDCPASGRVGPGGEGGTTVIPSLKSKVKINKGNMEE